MYEANTHTTDKQTFKYQSLIDQLLAMGCNPRRMLQDLGKNTATTSLLALSCFTTSERAEAFYANLRKAFKHAVNSIGDSLSEGILTNDDGMMTTPSTNGHFDFYEYEGCDLNKTFHITRKIA